MLEPTELQDVTAAFGVYEDQVLRDHLISHLLAAISAEAAHEVVFFGGTALARSALCDVSRQWISQKIRYTSLS